jgi:hypothetical protein
LRTERDLEKLASIVRASTNIADKQGSPMKKITTVILKVIRLIKYQASK